MQPNSVHALLQLWLMRAVTKCRLLHTCYKSKRLQSNRLTAIRCSHAKCRLSHTHTRTRTHFVHGVHSNGAAMTGGSRNTHLIWARPALHTYLGHALHSIPILGTPCTPYLSWARPALLLGTPCTPLGHALHSIPILGTPCTPYLSWARPALLLGTPCTPYLSAAGQ